MIHQEKFINFMRIRSFFIALALILSANAANAQGIGNLLKGIGSGSSDLGSTIGNVIEGVFTKSNLEVADLTGEYVSEGPAVTFKSDNLLKKAGGIAGAAALETKLNPYYEQYGLNGMPLSIDSVGNFSLTVMKIKLSGSIEKGSEEGTFRFNLKLGGSMKIGSFTAYVEKSGKNMNLMFDATKLKELISTVASVSGVSMAKTLASLLDSYDGACVGFKMKYAGNASNIGNEGEEGNEGNVGQEGNSDNISTGVNALRNLLNKKK